MVKDKDGNAKEVFLYTVIYQVTVTQDDGIRKDTTYEGLAKLKPALKKGGSTTT